MPEITGLRISEQEDLGNLSPASQVFFIVDAVIDDIVRTFRVELDVLDQELGGSGGASLANTDFLGEGVNNLYFTQTRVSQNVDVAANTSTVGALGTAAFLNVGLGANNVVQLNAQGEIDSSLIPSISSGAGIQTLNGLSPNGLGALVIDTSAIGESGNLYYTDARVALAPAVVTNTTDIGTINTTLGTYGDIVTLNQAEVVVLDSGEIPAALLPIAGFDIYFSGATLPKQPQFELTGSAVISVVDDAVNGRTVATINAVAPAAFTTTTADYTQPAIDSSVVVTVGETNWVAPGQNLFIENGGVYEVVTVDSSTQLTLQNVGSGSNVDPAIIVGSGAKVVPSGEPGQEGVAGSVAVASSVDLNEQVGTPSPIAGRTRLFSNTANVVSAVFDDGTVLNLTPTLILDEGQAYTRRNQIRFSGTGYSISDDAANEWTDINLSIPATSDNLPEGTTNLYVSDANLLANLEFSTLKSDSTTLRTDVDAALLSITALQTTVDDPGTGVAAINTLLGTYGNVVTFNVGVSASNVVQLDGSARLPAVDASLLTNLPVARPNVVTSTTAPTIDNASHGKDYHLSLAAPGSLALPTLVLDSEFKVRLFSSQTLTFTGSTIRAPGVSGTSTSVPYNTENGTVTCTYHQSTDSWVLAW